MRAWNPLVLCVCWPAQAGHGRWGPTGDARTLESAKSLQHLPAPFKTFRLFQILASLCGAPAASAGQTVYMYMYMYMYMHIHTPA